MGSTAWLAGCASKKQEAASSTGATSTPSKPAADPGAVTGTVKPGGRVVLSAPSQSRNWKEVRLQAARRLVAANPDITYMGKPPDLLRAIPVLTFELNADGTIRRVEVMRYPSQDRETVNIAVESMRRAAPFGNVSHLPKPWRFNETFLFNNQHKFKPMTLDQL
ncbi:MAG: hypothetical protein H7225_10090 [Massilia sp.]|nr:hypothetical protein [Aquabacterium sp.]